MNSAAMTPMIESWTVDLMLEALLEGVHTGNGPEEDGKEPDPSRERCDTVDSESLCCGLCSHGLE